MATIASRLYSRLTSERLPRVVVAARPTDSGPATLHVVLMLILAAIIVAVALMGLVAQLPAWVGEPPVVG